MAWKYFSRFRFTQERTKTSLSYHGSGVKEVKEISSTFWKFISQVVAVVTKWITGGQINVKQYCSDSGVLLKWNTLPSRLSIQLHSVSGDENVIIPNSWKTPDWLADNFNRVIVKNVSRMKEHLIRFEAVWSWWTKAEDSSALLIFFKWINNDANLRDQSNC